MPILLLILAVWLILMVIGFVAKALIWLAIIGAVAFVITAAVGAAKRKQIGR